MLQELAAADPRVKVIRLRRNFGQTPALRAGIDAATGDVLVTMDGDLQNDPADIPLLLDKLDEGLRRRLRLCANRQDHFFIRKLPSLLGNWLIRRVTGVRIRDMGCTLRALRRDLAEALPLVRRTAPFRAGAGANARCQHRADPRPSSRPRRRQNQVRPDAHRPRAARSHHGQVPAHLSDAADARPGHGRPRFDGAGRASVCWARWR